MVPVGSAVWCHHVLFSSAEHDSCFGLEILQAD